MHQIRGKERQIDHRRDALPGRAIALGDILDGLSRFDFLEPGNALGKVAQQRLTHLWPGFFEDQSGFSTAPAKCERRSEIEGLAVDAIG